MNPDDARVRAHNLRQRTYFEGSEQRTLKPTGSPYLRRHTARMMELAGIRPGDRVLEAGCGEGRYTLLLAEHGVKVEGLDLAPAVLSKLAAHNGGRYDIPLHAGDILECPTEMDGAFDAVIGFFVVHHVHDIRATLARAARLVKPGGAVGFIEPNPFNPLYYLQITFTPEMRWREEKGIFQMRPRVVVPAMHAAGLRQTKWARFGFFPPFITNRGFGEKLESAFEKVGAWNAALPFQYFGGKRPEAL